MNTDVVLRKCQAMDVSNHLPSGNLGIWALPTPSASNAAHPTKPQIPPAIAYTSHHPCPVLCVSAADSSSTFVPRNRNNFFLQHRRPGGCTCSAPTAAKFPCANAHNDLARPCHRPRHSGQMSSPAFRCYLTENHMMSKGLTRPPTF